MAELCDELKNCVVVHDNGIQMIAHHFVHTLYSGAEPENDLYNKMLREKKKYFDRAIADGKYGHASILIERPYRCEFAHRLIVLDETLSGAAAAEMVAHIWVDTENMWQNKELWYELLEAVKDHKKEFMDDDYEKFMALPEKLTIYRGFDEEQGDMYGFSWTLSKEKAEWFANRFSPDAPEVIQLEVDKDEVFAYLTRRGEEEIIYTGEY